MFKKLLNIICLFSIISVASVAVANYQISPVKLSLSKENKVDSLNFQNDGDAAKSFQVTVLKRDKSKSEKTYKPSKDLIASPKIFKVSPKASQLIRVAMKNISATSENDDDYRISIKEVPQGPAESNGVRFITEMSIPVKIK